MEQVSLTCASDTGTAVHNDGRAERVSAPLGPQIAHARSLVLAHVQHEVEERRSRAGHAVVWPTRKLEVRDFSRLLRLKRKTSLT